MYNKKQNNMNKEFLYMQKLAGVITESEYKAILNENISFPEWYDSFVEKLATKLNERVDLDKSDLRFEMVDPHLMGLDATMFGDKGLKFFPTAVRSVLKDPEFAGKAMMVWDNTGQIEDRLVAKHPELEDFIYNDEMFWIYIK